MRNFNEYEKETLALIVSRQKLSDQDSIFKTLAVRDLYEKVAEEESVSMEVDLLKKNILIKSDKPGLSLQEGTLYFDEDNSEHLSIQVSNILYKTCLLLSLLDYLIKNRLIYLFQLFEAEEDKIILNDKLRFKEPPFGIEYLEDELFLNIYPDFKKSIISTPELVEFVKNGFRDEEQIRHENNVMLQKQSIGLATGLAAISIIISLISLVPEERKKQLFGITKDNVPVERHVSGRSTGTVISKQIKASSKQPTDADKQ